MENKFKFIAVVIFCFVGISIFAEGNLPVSLQDNFANRSLIKSAATISGSFSNATSEVGEPLIAEVSSGQTQWGTWIAPSNGIVTLFPSSSTITPLLGIYTGNDFTNLSLIASNNFLTCYEHTPCGCHWRERNQVSFHVVGGQAYQICVDSPIITDASWEQPNSTSGWNFFSWSVVQTTNVITDGTFEIGLFFTPAPKNDDFAHRLNIVGTRVVTNVSNTGATKEVGEPDHLGNPGGSSVWFSWKAPASGRVALSTNAVPEYSVSSTSEGFLAGFTISTIPLPTCGKEIDQNPPPIFYPVFAAYTGGAIGSLNPANCLPGALASFPNLVEFDAIKGQTYQIAFDGNLGTTGEIPFYLALTTPPPNDNFAQRIRLHGIYATATGYNAGATHQTGEPVFGDSNGKTAWWSWVAPVSGVVSIDLSGSDYAFPIAVRTGSIFAGMQLVGADYGGVFFTAVAGQTYQIAIGDSSGLTGKIKVKLQAPLVKLALSRIQNLGYASQLFFASAVGQVIVFQSSKDGTVWKNVQTQTATGNTIVFRVMPTSPANSIFYQAIIADTTR